MKKIMTIEFPEYEGYIFKIGGFVSEGFTDTALPSNTTILFITDKKVSGRRKTAVEAGAAKRTFPMTLDLLLEGQRISVSNQDYVLGDNERAMHVPAYVLEVVEGKYKDMKYVFLKDM